MQLHENEDVKLYLKSKFTGVDIAKYLSSKREGHIYQSRVLTKTGEVICVEYKLSDVIQYICDREKEE